MDNTVIKNMSFPNHDINWQEIIGLLEDNSWQNINTIAPVEFCNKLGNCFPYEWSYWNNLEGFQCIIIHKGMYDRLRNNFLDKLEDTYDYIFGNTVFNIYISSELNKNNLQGHEVHFSLNTIIQALKKLLKLGKQFKTKLNKKNILLVTANCSGNIGDDAITLASHGILQSVYPNANIVIDKGPASKELISKVDLLVLGGGGIFYDGCFYNAQNYCQYLLYASEYGVRACGIGIGAQGILSKYGIELFKESINRAEFIIVRDMVSAEILQKRVKTNSEIIINQDVVFSFSFNPIKSSTINNERILLCSLIDADETTVSKDARNYTQKYNNNQMECMEFLSKTFKVKCVVQSNDDIKLYKKFEENFNIEIIKINLNDIKDILNIYAKAELIITSRLHGYIFSVLANKPVISVTADNPNLKLAGLIKNHITSTEAGLLSQNEYCLTNIKQMISKFNSSPVSFKPSISEVGLCKESANMIPKIIKRHLGTI